MVARGPGQTTLLRTADQVVVGRADQKLVGGRLVLARLNSGAPVHVS